jgi:hypothetical protein
MGLDERGVKVRLVAGLERDQLVAEDRLAPLGNLEPQVVRVIEGDA